MEGASICLDFQKAFDIVTLEFLHQVLTKYNFGDSFKKWVKILYNHADWLVDCFGFNGPLRQYFSLYLAVSQREGERGERIDESKNVQTTPTRTYCKRNRPMPYCNPNCRTPRHWKVTQQHRTTRPPPNHTEASVTNNGWISKYFRIQKGIRQGCPLSALLCL